MKAKAQQQRADDDVRAVMATAAGRRFVWRLLTQAGLHSSSFASTAEATAYNEGRRSVAIALMAEVQRVTPELYTKALREELDEQEQLFRKQREADEAAAVAAAAE